MRRARPVVVRPVVVRPAAPVARAMVTTAAVVGTAAVVSNAMNRPAGGGGGQCHGGGGHTTVIVQQGAPPPQNSSEHIYVLSSSGFYLTESDKKKVAGRNTLDPQLSVWHEQHVGNGYFVLRSHNQRLLSVDGDHAKLSKIHTPVKQKCMFYREVVEKQVRYRSTTGKYLTIPYGGNVKFVSSPSFDSLFTLQLAPATPQAAPTSHAAPPPPTNVGLRDVNALQPTSYAPAYSTPEPSYAPKSVEVADNPSWYAPPSQPANPAPSGSSSLYNFGSGNSAPSQPSGYQNPPGQSSLYSSQQNYY
jgi:hypothetical protein